MSTTSVDRENIPIVPTAEAPANSGDDVRLRRFHLGAPGAAEPLPADVLPLALWGAAGDMSPARHYPCCVSPAPRGETLPGAPLTELLNAAFLHVPFLPPTPVGVDAATIPDFRRVRDRLEEIVRERVEAADQPLSAAGVVGEVGRELIEEMGLENDREFVDEQLDELTAAIPAGRLVSFADSAPVWLFALATSPAVVETRREFSNRTRLLAERIRERLGADSENRPAASSAGTIGSKMGDLGGIHFDAGKLAEVLKAPRGGSVFDDERRTRIGESLARLQEFVDTTDAQRPTLIHDGSLVSDDEPALRGWRVLREPLPLAASQIAFDDGAAEMAKVLAESRRAELVLEDLYEPDRHDDWFAQFGWESFTRDELRLLSPVVALVSEKQLVERELGALSRLLVSGRPVQVVVVSRPADSPGGGASRFEPGYFGMSHREAFVHQGTVARPAELLRGFQAGIASVRPALHVVASSQSVGDKPPHCGAWPYTWAALESRAQPAFTYDPEAGASWAERFNIESNPEPGEAWGVANVRLSHEGKEETWSLPFTFGDFALSEPTMAGEFALVPLGVDGELFITLDAYLALSSDEAAERVPFVWAVDGENRVRRVVVTRRLAAISRDRLNFWRTVQELAGVHNAHVEAAERRLRAEADDRIRDERERLEVEHAAALEQARERGSVEAVYRLTDALLSEGPDFASLLDGSAPVPAAPPYAPAVNGAAPASPAAAPPSAASAPAAEAAPAPAAEAAPAPAAEAAPPSEEPWIETELCTTCHECTNLNPSLFVYNDDKQAVIKNPRGGPFKDIVVAAERCPARIIHPGVPLNPDEPGLDKLVARASKFN